MARALISDPFHNFRFHAIASQAGSLLPFGDAQAGFTTISLPTKTIEVAEYKEGTMTFRRKYPGEMTVDDVTLGRGVSKAGTEMIRLIEATQTGKEYRFDVTIRHYHRKDISTTADNAANLTLAGTPARTIQLFNAFGTSVKVGSDLDSMRFYISVK
jgi:phage tail-like protein